MTTHCAKCNGAGMVYVSRDAVERCPACNGEGTSGRTDTEDASPAAKVENMRKVAGGIVGALEKQSSHEQESTP